MRRLPVRPFVLALALSVAAHLWLLFTPQIHFSFDTPSSPPVIEARLVTAPPPAVAAVPEAKPKPRPKRQPRKAPQQQTSMPPEKTTAPETHPEPPAQPVADASPEPAPPQPAKSTEERPSKPEPAVPETTSPPGGHLPALAEIEFVLYKGKLGLKVGKVVHKWQVLDHGYVISSMMEGTGIFSLIKSGRMVQTSQGKLSVNGLEPDSFWIQRGQSANTTESAQFDRRNNTLTYGSGAERRAVPLPPQAQDLLSFVYQLAFGAPQAGAIQLFITNGRKLDSYDYGVVGEETLDTPMGNLKALHLRKVRTADEDGVDIWLGADYHYLPVKVRITDKDGDSVEQVASKIDLK